MADVRSTLRDAAYVGIGFGVLAFQKAQVQRQELKKQLETSVSEGKAGFGKLGEDVQDRLKVVEERLEALGKQVDAAADDFEERLDKTLDELQERLPEQVKDLFGKARAAGKDARSQVRSLVRQGEKAAEKTTKAA
jgi:DNA anti-recombination protein RmuC